MTWEKFLNYEYEEFMDGKNRPLDPMEAASELYTELGGASFRKDVVKAFGGEYSEDTWSYIINSIQENGAVSLLPRLFNGLIVTTNFDRLLEHLYPSAVLSYPGRAVS